MRRVDGVESQGLRVSTPRYAHTSAMRRQLHDPLLAMITMRDFVVSHLGTTSVPDAWRLVQWRITDDIVTQ
jgi:hypothetical protein